MPSAGATPNVMKMAKLLLAVLVLGLILAACGGDGGGGVTLGKKIAFLLPDSQAARYESRDLPVFQAKVKSVCSDCTVDYRIAHGDPATHLTLARPAPAVRAYVIDSEQVNARAASAIAAQPTTPS